MIAHERIYKLPVELSFRQATSLYTKRIVALLAVALQCWLVMMVLTLGLVLVHSRPLVATSVLSLVVISGVLAVNYFVYRKFSVKRVRSPQDIENNLNLTTLAVIPRARSIRPLSENSERGLLDADFRSPLAEAYRHLRTSLLLSRAGNPPRSILFTSSVPAEGTTTTALNTAAIIAATGADVLLIDSNLRSPSLHARLGIRNENGLSNILAGVPRSVSGGENQAESDRRPDSKQQMKQELLQLVSRLPFEVSETVEYDESSAVSIANQLLVQPGSRLSNIWVMTAGPLAPNPAELLGSKRMKEVLELAAKNFKHVILDSPPITSFTDAQILSTMVDASVLVISPGTPLAEAQRSKTLLSEVGARIVGAVLNNHELQQSDYYSYYYNNEFAVHESEPSLEEVRLRAQ